jgi:hypothetical protein
MKPDKFPITGRDVCALLSAFPDEMIWRLADVETLSAGDTPQLGDLWNRVQAGEVLISTRELCTQFEQATQVISLSLFDAQNSARELFVEDGRLESNTLEPN